MRVCLSLSFILSLPLSLALPFFSRVRKRKINGTCVPACFLFVYLHPFPCCFSPLTLAHALSRALLFPARALSLSSSLSPSSSIVFLPGPLSISRYPSTRFSLSLSLASLSLSVSLTPPPLFLDICVFVDKVTRICALIITCISRQGYLKTCMCCQVLSEDCFYYYSERNHVVVLFGTLKV